MSGLLEESDKQGDFHSYLKQEDDWLFNWNGGIYAVLLLCCWWIRRKSRMMMMKRWKKCVLIFISVFYGHVGGNRTPGHRVQYRVEVEVRSAVWCVWRRTCRARLFRLRNGNAHTLHDLSPNRAATISSAQIGWRWNGLRYKLFTHSSSHQFVHPSHRLSINSLYLLINQCIHLPSVQLFI